MPKDSLSSPIWIRGSLMRARRIFRSVASNLFKIVTLHHSGVRKLMIMLNYPPHIRDLAQPCRTLEASRLYPRRAPTRTTCRGDPQGGTMTVFSELRMRPVTAATSGWNASTPARLVISGAVFFMLLGGATLATPLYPL